MHKDMHTHMHIHAMYTQTWADIHTHLSLCRAKPRASAGALAVVSLAHRPLLDGLQLLLQAHIRLAGLLSLLHPPLQWAHGGRKSESEGG